MISKTVYRIRQNDFMDHQMALKDVAGTVEQNKNRGTEANTGYRSPKLRSPPPSLCASVVKSHHYPQHIVGFVEEAITFAPP